MIRVERRITGSLEHCCLFCDESEGISDMNGDALALLADSCRVMYAFVTDAALMHDDQNAGERLQNEGHSMPREDLQDGCLVSSEQIYMKG